jgi:hypothetical protein
MNSVTFSDTAAVGNAAKVSAAVREFAVFPPDNPGVDPLRVVVSDRMTTVSTQFEQRWTLYYSGTPVVDGNPSAGPARGNPSSTDGKTTYTGATLITATSGEPTAGNKLWVRPIFPKDFKVVLVNFRRNIQVEDPYGLMHGTSAFNADNAPYVGSYRTEVIPTTPQASQHFVTALEVTSVSGAQSATEAIEGVNFKGARIGDRIAVFGSAVTAPAGSFVIPRAGTYRMIMADMGLGSSRTLTPGGTITVLRDVQTGSVSSSFVANASGVIYLEVTVAASGTGSAKTITVGDAVGGVFEVLVPPTGSTGSYTVPAPTAPSGLRIIR